MIGFKTIGSGSLGNCYIINDGHTHIMLECGLSMRDIKAGLEYDFSKIKVCLLTHEHKDHSKSAVKLAQRGLPVCASAGTLSAINQEWEYLGNFRKVNAGETLVYGSFMIKPFLVEHDAREPLGYFIYSKKTKERVLFATDTHYIKPSFPNLNYIFIECSFDEEILAEKESENPDFYTARLKRSHMSLQMLEDYLSKTDTTKVVEVRLLHMSNGSIDEAKAIRNIQLLTRKPTYAE